MRAPSMLIGTGLSAVAALVLVTGCTSSGGSKSASGTSSSTSATKSSAAAVGGGGAGFCNQARAFAAQVASSVGSQPNQTTGQNFQRLAAQLQSINPPSEIASDWQTAVTSIQQLGVALQSLNPSDPSQAAQLEQQVAPIEDKLTTAGDHIDAYLKQKCGIDVNGGASSTS